MPKGDEAQIVEDIRQVLTLKGYIVQRIGQRRADLSGSDVVGDLQVTHEKWPIAVSLCADAKTLKGKLSKRRPAYKDGTYGYSQQDLFDMGRLLVWRNSMEAEADVIRFERSLSLLRTLGESLERGK